MSLRTVALTVAAVHVQIPLSNQLVAVNHPCQRCGQVLQINILCTVQLHGVTPTTVYKSREAILGQTSLSDSRRIEPVPYADQHAPLALAAEPVVSAMGREELEKLIKKTEKQMEAAAKELDFLQAAKLRDELAALKTMLKGKRE